ncbi:hypothetical protein [Streptococcus ruminantium]|uniref:hypothetical protein n=1 Tax=Streptococcus ruminantium TaxID=1917441 RepID=UPI0012DD9501|nr:hypothetical protein [Streptococcus ruminantium]
MVVDLAKYPLEELYQKFEEINKKREVFKRFEQTILEKKAHLQKTQEVNLDNLEEILEKSKQLPSEEIDILNDQLKRVSTEFYDELYSFQSHVPWYIHFETRRQIRKNGLEKKYRKILQLIVSNFEELTEIQSQVQKINDHIALELSEKYDLSGCRTETELYRITPFFRTYHGVINLPMELKEVKDFLKDK